MHVIRGDGMFHTYVEVHRGDQVMWLGPEVAVGAMVIIRESERTLRWLDNDTVEYVVDGLFDSARGVTYAVAEPTVTQSTSPPWERRDELDDDYDVPIRLLEEAGPDLLTVEPLTIPDGVPAEYTSELEEHLETMRTQLQSWWRARAAGTPLSVRVLWEAGPTAVHAAPDGPPSMVATLHRTIDGIPTGQAGADAATADFGELISVLEQPHGPYPSWISAAE